MIIHTEFIKLMEKKLLWKKKFKKIKKGKI